MKSNYLLDPPQKFFLAVMMLILFHCVQAQEAPSIPDTSKITYNQISNGLKLHAYPAKGQDQQQQKNDEIDCYKWAMKESGVDPLNIPKVEVAPAKKGPTGAAVAGAAKGAAAGAAIGAVANDDAGNGAATGAVVGGIAGRRKGKKAQAQQNQKAQTDAASKEKELKDSFTKAFSACLEGKGYTIK
ncbi:MAG: glycine zipper domain-containing protein [Flavisolibacter sp.]